MANWQKTIAIDVSALPQDEPFFEKLVPLFRERVEERSGAKVTETADYTLSFRLNKALAAEAFEIRTTDAGAEISGADFNALVFGMGRFLHSSRYDAQGMEPSAWRGVSVPKSDLRGVYFAMHFFNWYQQCRADELERYVEDLMLWGVNAIFVIFPRISLSSWDDPETERVLGNLRKTFAAAKKMNMKTGFQSSNQDFCEPDPRYAADKSLLGVKAGNLICPGTEGGYQHLKGIITRVLRELKPIGVDYMSFFSFDEGGCSCKNCWPWASRGLYNYAKRMSREIREELLPDVKIILATWYFGRGENNGGDWDGFYERVRKDEEAGDDWLDAILIETRDHPACQYILEHGRPSERIRTVTFPDICMMGLEPWGGWGAVIAPHQVCEEQLRYKDVADGCYMYSEGKYDDLHKAVCAQLFWDYGKDPMDTVAEYIGYEYPGTDVQKGVELIRLVEDNHRLTNKFSKKPADMEKAKRALEICEEMDRAIYAPLKQSWRWRIVYARVHLDWYRYSGAEKEGWPYERYLQSHRNDFWADFTEGNAEAEAYLLELIHIYHAMEVNTPGKYYLHASVRPPLRNDREGG